MKILSIKALNVNSLKGTTEINFEELTKDNALFSITGPTGSGKSTILDIISCALYGRTARLKNPNDLMSRHCGESYCEVEFEIKGKRYRSSWTQKRARNKHDGKFQTAKMELSDLADAKPLALKSRDVPKKIEELSGLDFGRFSQSMMLAQGGFDAFLKADEKERSALLEKITGTQIYAEISIAIFDKHRDLQQDMDSDLKILESIELLGEELVQEKENNLEHNIAQKKKTDEELKELNSALHWVQRLSELILEVKKYEQEFIEATKVKKEHKNSFAKLSLANRALNVSSTFTSHTQLHHSITTDRTTLTKLSKEIEALNEDIKKENEEYSLVKKEFENESTAFEIQKQKLKLAREIQTQEKQTEQTTVKTQVLLKSKQENLIETTKSLNSLIEKFESRKKQIETKTSYFQNNAKDEKLASTIGIIEQNIAHYKEEEKSLVANQKKLKLLDTGLLEEQTKYKLIKEEVNKLSVIFTEKELAYQKLDENSSNDLKTQESIQKSLEDSQALLRALDSYTLVVKKRDDEQKEKEKNGLEEKSLLQTHQALQEHIEGIKKHIETLRDKKEKEQLLKKYEDDRNNLLNGEACSLCGSTDHPYANGLNEVHIDETQAMITSQIQALQEKENASKELESRLVSTQTKIETSKLELQKLEQEIQTLQNTFKQYSFEVTDESELNLKEKEEALHKQLHELKLRRAKKDELLKQRDKAREVLQVEEKSCSELHSTIQKNTVEKEHIASNIKSKQSNIKEYIQSLKAHFKEFDLELDVEKIDTQYLELVNRKEIYSQTLEALKVLELEQNKCELDKKESQTQVASTTTEIETDTKNLKELESSMIELTAKRIEILNVADLDAHEKEVTSKYETTQNKEQLSKEKLNELITKNEERSTYKKTLDTKILEDEHKLKQLTSKLEELYKENDFKNEQELQSALVSNEEREKLVALCKAVEDKYTQTQTLNTQSTQKLLEHQKEPVSDRQSAELKIMQSLLEQKTNALQESIGSDKKELELNKENSDKHKGRIASLEVKKEAFKVWVKLNELVGSADGTKFKKFAQGITLDQLISLANQHLNNLSSRYTLARSPDKLLELEVIDAYQGNVVRPVSTLSGGESFIVSLALALGLSELASQKIAIDSLFLDEGFGTLDEESLETALNALNLLQSGGKMVGVISHVEALKERIPLQIKVVKNGDGTSFVEVG
ncbi:MAG: exonuclease SbcC [Sulfurimonas sp.]|jgi:exonuclease SbcC|uniref:SbcC/MukB-like Walker B domain-containing protein n=1 Tax=Sulfurimonas sp. TaxID=2022749 RepID=UPI0039E64C17